MDHCFSEWAFGDPEGLSAAGSPREEEAEFNFSIILCV